MRVGGQSWANQAHLFRKPTPCTVRPRAPRPAPARARVCTPPLHRRVCASISPCTQLFPNQLISAYLRFVPGTPGKCTLPTFHGISIDQHRLVYCKLYQKYIEAILQYARPRARRNIKSVLIIQRRHYWQPDSRISPAKKTTSLNI